MAYEFEPEVEAALLAHGWLVDGRLRRRELAEAIAKWLEDDHVADSVEEAQDVAATNDEIAIGLLGVTDTAIHDLIAALSGPRGMVQMVGLSDGLVLASVRVARMVEVDGVPPRPMKFAARFLSSDPTVLRETVIAVAQGRAANAIAGMNSLLGTVGSRVPELDGDRVRVLNAIAQKATQLSLPETTTE